MEQKLSTRIRPETGPMEFPGDWPGIFIRGDHAMMYRMAIDTVVTAIYALKPSADFDYMQVMILKGLGDLLVSADTRTTPITQKACFVEENPST